MTNSVVNGRTGITAKEAAQVRKALKANTPAEELAALYRVPVEVIKTFSANSKYEKARKAAALAKIEAEEAAIKAALGEDKDDLGENKDAE